MSILYPINHFDQLIRYPIHSLAINLFEHPSVTLIHHEVAHLVYPILSLHHWSSSIMKSIKLSLSNHQNFNFISLTQIDHEVNQTLSIIKSSNTSKKSENWHFHQPKLQESNKFYREINFTKIQSKRINHQFSKLISRGGILVLSSDNQHLEH